MNLRINVISSFQQISIHNKDYENFAKSIFSAAEFLTENWTQQKCSSYGTMEY